MNTSDFDYPLPKELIAQTPVEPRDHSRLMVVSRASGSIQHRRFCDLPEYLRPDDVMVFNDSRVMPARLYGKRVGSGKAIELLLLHRLAPGMWRALVRPGRRLTAGATFEVGEGDGRIGGEVIDVNPDGTRTVRLPVDDALHRLGVVPLPPYIHKPLKDPERYQTVYARAEGSVAAPTAGLHFTTRLLDRIQGMGVETTFVTLHVGWDSFQPVRSEDISAHTLHSEYWELSPEAAEAINSARNQGRRVIAVGTTTVRLLEQAAALAQSPEGELRAGTGWADLFITPGYLYRIVDALVTNFHLPQSTLLMLTSAFAGRDLLLRAYREAAERRYRFYSLGDAMLVL